MKKSVSILLGFALTQTLFSFSQKREFDPSNAREGETVEYCFQHKKMQELKKNPAFLQSLIDDENIRAHEAAGTDVEKATVYRIPIVFHVLHYGGAENISDEQIMDALAILNRDWKRENPDTANVHADFDGMPSDMDIEFVLATKAPNGECFKGITRTYHALSWDGNDGDAQVDAIVAGNDVYQGEWPGNKYLNVFICGDIGGAAGYTMLPSNWVGTNMRNGIWVLQNYVGSIGTSSVYTSRTLTHECGHWLNLDHTWGGNNNPGNTSVCTTDDDGVQDTPRCIGVSSCNISSNTCSNDNAYWGFDIRDNVENYMDYSYCSKMFTPGQVTRCRNAVTSSVGGRNNLWTATNLNNTGATGVLTLCETDFSSSMTSVCVGESVQFTDETFNAATGWTWVFPSGTPSSSTDENPVVTYNTPGVYSVTLTSTDGTSTDTEVKTGYITVLAPSATLPFHEGFEAYTSLAGLSNWQVSNPNNNAAFEITTSAAHSGSKSVKLANFGQTGSNIDELFASPVDLSEVSSNGSVVTLSFRYAYRKRTAADVEWLKVFVSNDCGEDWVQRKTIGGTQLSSLTSSTSWTPTSADWTTVHMTNVTSDYWVDNFRYKFRFEGNNGNNFYLDNINIYLGAPSDNLVLVGIEENSKIDGLSIYPNPADDEMNLLFNVESAQAVQVQIQDLYGKIAQNHLINANSGSNMVMMNTNQLAAGVYFVTVKTGTAQQVLQFIVK